MTLCARPGCTAETAGKYCSKRCSAVARLCAGWIPQASILRPEVRAKACRNGALAASRIARKRRAKTILERLRPLLIPRFCGDLDSDERAGVLALMAKAFRLGKAVGYQQGYHAKDTPRLKRRQNNGEAA